MAPILILALAGCVPAARGPRPIETGAPCAVCGMRIEDLRYACEDERQGGYRTYDSIECLLRAEPSATRVWLADFDTRTLHSAESTWVVEADIPSPMGGGYAAFLDRTAAEEIAVSRRGRVARLSTFAADSVVPDSSSGQR